PELSLCNMAAYFSETHAPEHLWGLWPRLLTTAGRRRTATTNAILSRYAELITNESARTAFERDRADSILTNSVSSAASNLDDPSQDFGPLFDGLLWVAA